MLQRVSFSLLSVMGCGRRLATAACVERRGYMEVISHYNDVDIGWRGVERRGYMGVISHYNDVDIGWRVFSVCDDSCEGVCAMCKRCRLPEQTRANKMTLNLDSGCSQHMRSCLDQ
jgi:hypothetical protein